MRCTRRKQFPRTTAPISPEPSQRSTSTMGSAPDSLAGQLHARGKKMRDGALFIHGMRQLGLEESAGAAEGSR